MSTWEVFKDLMKKKCLIKNVSLVQQKKEKTGEKLDGHISDEEYLTCKKMWKEFAMKNMGDYHDHYLK